MIDLVKSGKWRNLREKIKRHGMKTDHEQEHIDLAMMAAIENVHDISERSIESAKFNQGRLDYVSEYVNTVMVPVMNALVKDPRIMDILKEHMEKEVYDRIFYGEKKEEEKDVNNA